MNTQSYRIQVVNHSQTWDLQTSQTEIYLIDSWVFRLLDGHSLRDYQTSAPRPQSAWDDMYLTQEAWEEDAKRRAEARRAWDQAVIERITGRKHTLDECEVYTITQVLTEVFCAVKITRMEHFKPAGKTTNRGKLLMELSQLSNAQLGDALFGKANDRLLERLDGMSCRACKAAHGGRCPYDDDTDIDATDCPKLAEWLGMEADGKALIPADILTGGEGA